jgi:hypothetical protein
VADELNLLALPLAPSFDEAQDVLFQRGEVLKASFRREGEYWVIRYKAPVFRLKDRIGLRYLALLLNNPGREFLAIDLVAAVQGGPDRPRSKDGAQGGALGSPGPYFDEEARRAYTQRLLDLRAALEEAEAFNDVERASRAQAEIDSLAEELARGIGLGRRVRPSGSPVERARVNVTLAIRGALRAIGRSEAALARYLAATIKTGTYCCYSPDPNVAVNWEL